MRRQGIQNNKIVWLVGGTFLLGFLFGVFLVTEMETYFWERAGLISDYSFRQMKYQEYDKIRLLKYFFGKRMKWIVLMAGITVIYGVYFLWGVMSGWLGFSIGFTGMIAVVKFGIKGIFMITLGMLPQSVFYIWGIGILLYYLSEWEKDGRYWKYFPIKKFIKGMTILFVGILTESYINPYCLDWIYELL